MTTSAATTTTTTIKSDDDNNGTPRHQRHRYNRPVEEFVTNNFALNRKIKEACQGVGPTVQRLVLELRDDEDKEAIADFITDWSNSIGKGRMMATPTKGGYISSLVYLSRYLGHKKSFKEMTKEDIVDGYLKSLKREFKVDPDEKWINTHNTRAGKILAFWEWFTQKDLTWEERQRPPQLKGIRFPRRKVRTSVKPEQLWTPEEHKVFLERCEDLRLACYHSIALETGGRPGELLQVKMKDIQIKTSPSTGKNYAEFWIGQYGKSKKARPVTISDSIPRLNVWVHVHPNRDNPQGDAYLFPSLEKSSKYRNKPLQVDSLRLLYVRTLTKGFSKFLDDPEIPLEDKAVIKPYSRNQCIHT